MRRIVFVAATVLMAVAFAEDQPCTVVPTDHLSLTDSSGVYWWKNRHEAKLREIKQLGGSVDVVLLGDSITQNWEGAWGGQAYAELREEFSVLNLGYGGDRTQNTIWRCLNGELDGYDAKCVVVLSGTNNGYYEKLPPETIAAGVSRIVELVREKQPRAKVLLMPLLPRYERRDDPLRLKNDRVNELIRPLADGQRVIWTDISGAFARPDGTPNPPLYYTDLCHPGAEGYKVFKKELVPYLRRYVRGGCFPERSQDLGGTWRLTGSDASGKPVDCSVSVPGGVHAALMASGRLEDPYFGDNEERIQWVGERDWTVERSFAADSSLLSRRSVILRLEDVDTFCDITLNGVPVGSTDNRFRRWDFDVKRLLKPGKNVLRGTFRSATAEARARRASSARTYSIQNSFVPGINLIRKPQCHGGWDWGPTLMETGFLGPVSLVGCDTARIDYAWTDVDFPSGFATARVRVSAEVWSPAGGKTEFAVKVGQVSSRAAVVLRPGTNVLARTVEIQNPELWWPAGEGAQPLYPLEIAVGGARLTRSIGLRKIELLTTPDVDPVTGTKGSRFAFRVNGREVFAKGANWIPADAIADRRTNARYRDLLVSAKAANMNMIRVWGGGEFERDRFYGLCDELGLLIWHDFMFACATYPADAAFLDAARAEITHQVKRLRDHPSIALWCGDNECIGVVEYNIFPEVIKNRDSYRKELIRREEVEGEVARACDPNRPFWASSPCSEASGYTEDWGSDARGDVHNWGVWWSNRDFDHYYSRRIRFCDEFGYQSFPSPEMARSITPEGQFNPLAPAFDRHQKAFMARGNGSNRILEAMVRNFRFPEGVDNLLWMSQIQQTVSVRSGVEFWRAIRPYCMGTMIWQYNDNWPSISWSMVEYGGKWKHLQYQARRFFAPVLPVAYSTDAGTNIEFRVVNDRSYAVSAKAVIALSDFDGKVLSDRTVELELAPASSVQVARIARTDFGASAEELNGRFVRFDLAFTDRGAEERARTEWFFSRYRDLPLASADVRMAAADTDGLWTVTLEADKPAFFVWVNAEGVPGEFDDNSFTLIPGEKRTLVFTPKDPQSTFDVFKRSLAVTHLRKLYK